MLEEFTNFDFDSIEIDILDTSVSSGFPEGAASSYPWPSCSCSCSCPGPVMPDEIGP